MVDQQSNGNKISLASIGSTLNRRNKDLAEGKKAKSGDIDVGKILRMFVVPLLGLSIFLGILFVLIIPAVGNVFAALEEIEVIRSDIDQANNTANQLRILQAGRQNINNSLQLVNTLVPTGSTEVVNFQQRIALLASEKSLAVIGSQTEEEILSVEEDNPLLGIVEIPSKFTLSGKLVDIQDFLSAITSLPDFVIIGEMELSVMGKVDPGALDDTQLDWSLVITLVKYQFIRPNEQNKLAQAYANVPPGVKIDQEVITFVEQKVLQEEAATVEE